MSLNNVLHLAHTLNPEDIPSDRLRGQSTAIALRAVSDAITKPGTQVVVKDHVNTKATNVRTLNMVEIIVKRMKLVGFSTGYDPVLGNYFCQFDLYTKESK